MTVPKRLWPRSRAAAALAGASLRLGVRSPRRRAAVLGSELLQFGGAEPLGEGRWRLTRLLRGRVGTEWATDLHTAGETFALMERDTLAAVELFSLSGATVYASMRNLSGTISVSAPVTVRESLRR